MAIEWLKFSSGRFLLEHWYQVDSQWRFHLRVRLSRMGTYRRVTHNITTVVWEEAK